ncbi:hypothetical protein E2C01_045129 [Portunus trituberculatus]|uniref:Uncharacterized protein n=1 Tax=Portunus trituberculatus TaxID=210409 RepID=A0A5B7G477_PORTR|nr:hypothetical protein [Portunus trituberculatus]
MSTTPSLCLSEACGAMLHWSGVCMKVGDNGTPLVAVCCYLLNASVSVTRHTNTPRSTSALKSSVKQQSQGHSFMNKHRDQYIRSGCELSFLSLCHLVAS